MNGLWLEQTTKTKKIKSALIARAAGAGPV